MANDDPLACRYDLTNLSLPPPLAGGLDHVYSFALGISDSVAALLDHADLEVPDARIIDVGGTSVPEAAKGGCGCTGITVGIGTASNTQTYENCSPKESWTSYEARVYICRHVPTEGDPLGVVGPDDGSVDNSINGATLETTRYYMALRRYLLPTLRQLEGCPKSVECQSIRDVQWRIQRQGRCNFVAAAFKVKI